MNTKDSTFQKTIAEATLYVLLGAAMIRFWLMPLGSSFWADEAGAFWTIKDGFRMMFVRMQVWPNTPPLFGVVSWVAYKLGGAHEYAIRLPSVIAIAIASWLLYRLATRLLDSPSALFVVAVFICLQPVVLAAADARPYALVLALAIGSTLALVRWFDTGHQRYAAIYVLVGSLVLYSHLLAFPVILVHAIYAAMRLRERPPVRFWHLLVAAIGTGFLIAPLVPFLLRAQHRVQSSIFAGPPYLPALADDLVPTVLVMGLGFGILISWLLCSATGEGRLGLASKDMLFSKQVLVLTLIVLPPGLFFAISAVTPIKIFVARYVILCNVGLALLVGWGIRRLQPESVRSVVTSVIILCSLGAFGSVGHVWPLHNNEDWRGAMALVRQVSGSERMPVVIQSPYVESGTMLRLTGDSPEFLLAPLAMYPVPGRVIAVPRPFSQHSIDYLNAVVIPDLGTADRFLLVTDGPLGVGNPYIAWLLGRLSNYSAQDLGSFGENIEVTLYERSSKEQELAR